MTAALASIGLAMSFTHAQESDGSAKAISDQPATALPLAPGKPRINGPRIFGVRPGAPFLYTIPATGARPIEFAAEALPAGLKLDAATGQITGKVPEPGEHMVILRASNGLGSVEKKFRVVVGDRIALTPL